MTRFLAGSVSLAILLGGGDAAAQPLGADTEVYIGSYGEAILGARLDSRTGRLTLQGPLVPVVDPTWLAVDPDRPILYSVSETGNDGKNQGGVLSLKIAPDTGALTAINKVPSGGGGATYLSYDRRVHSVFVGNFGGGQVAAIPVNQDGSLAPASSVVTDQGRGPDPKQDMPHAHGAVLDPGGHFVLVPDMGADRIFVYRYDAATGKLAPHDPAFEATPPGTGPRHLIFSPDGRFVYAVIELSGEVRSFRWDGRAGRLEPLQTVALDPPDFKGVRSAAELRMAPDGRFLYAASRARDALLVYAVDRLNGKLTLKQDTPCGGKTPRSFAIDPSGHWLIVAHENSGSIGLFKIDPASGMLTGFGAPVKVPFKPVAFAFYRR
jgi:6-phosphogluconolactonase